MPTRPFVRGALLDALDPETRALAIALYARPGPTRSSSRRARIAYAIDKLLITLERTSSRTQISTTWPNRPTRSSAATPRRCAACSTQQRQSTKNAARSTVEREQARISPALADADRRHGAYRHGRSP